MKWLWIIGWTYVVFVLHSGIVRELAVAGCTPHLVLAGLILMAVRIAGRQGVLIAAGWGLLLDCLTEGRLGVHVVCLTLATLAIQEVSVRWPLHAPWRLGILAGVVVGVEIVASTSLQMLPGGQGLALPTIVAHAAGSAFYTGLVVAVMSFAAQMVFRQPTVAAGALTPAVSNKWRMLTE